MAVATAPNPPLTNRGELRPNHTLIDWCKITVHQPLTHVLSVFCAYWGERAGYEPDFQLIGKTSKGKGQVYRDQRGVVIEAFGSTDYDPTLGPFCCIDFKGQQCRGIPDGEFAMLYEHLAGTCGRVRCIRLDLAFDCVPFTPFEIEMMLNERHINTRRKFKFPCWSEVGHEGKTTYIGKQHGQRECGMYARVYNKHGWNRYELQTSKNDNTADECMKRFCEVIVGYDEHEAAAHRTRVALGLIRRLCDFTDPDDIDERPARRRLWHKWEQFITDVEKMEYQQRERPQEEQEKDPAMRGDAWIHRNSKRLAALLAAYGMEQVAKRVEHHCPVPDSEEVKRLKTAKYGFLVELTPQAERGFIPQKPAPGDWQPSFDYAEHVRGLGEEDLPI